MVRSNQGYGGSIAKLYEKVKIDFAEKPRFPRRCPERRFPVKVEGGPLPGRFGDPTEPRP
jgi:hypothetical protein